MRSKTTFAVEFHSVVLQNFVSEHVFAKWENFKDFEDAFPGFCTFQFAICGWNCVRRYRNIRAITQIFARQLGDGIVVCSA